MSSLEEKYFLRSITRFLHSQLEQPTVSEDSKESLEVAIQCLETVYELNVEDPDFDKENPLNHIDLFEVFRSAFTNVTPERKAEAESLKNEGNRLMKEEKYQEALNTYSKAISLDATNPVFYCNRAAAHSRLGDYQTAADDCRMSLRYDPNYSKAFGRLGLACTKMNKHEQALEAYKNALRIEPDNQDYKNNMAVTQQRLEEQRAGIGSTRQGPGVNLGNIDFAAALNNPALVSMATRMMSDPGIQSMLGQLSSSMNNVDELLETGRQIAMQMSNDNPEMFATVIRQMEERGVAGNGVDPNAANNSTGTNPNPNSESSDKPAQPPADNS